MQLAGRGKINQIWNAGVVLILKGAFQKSELTGRTIAGPVILTMKNAFSPRVFVETPSLSCLLFRIWLIRLDSFDERWNSHYDWNGLGGQFWQMESALTATYCPQLDISFENTKGFRALLWIFLWSLIEKHLERNFVSRSDQEILT